jgi:predicted fused transcriptional regulator/phosphomethylpyrimidine kinase
MTYSLTHEEIEEIRDLIRLLDSRIDSGGDGEEPAVKLSAKDREQVARYVWRIQPFIS